MVRPTSCPEDCEWVWDNLDTDRSYSGHHRYGCTHNCADRRLLSSSWVLEGERRVLVDIECFAHGVF